MEFIHDREILRNELRLEDKVLRRITRDRKLGRDDEFRARRDEALVSGDDLIEITAQIPDRGIDLSEANLHAGDADYAQPALQQRLSRALFADGEGVASSVLVAGVQRVIRARDEDSAPFDEASGEKRRDRADDYLLKERRMHLW